MPEIVPSQIVDFIDEHFGFAKQHADYALDRQFNDRVSALLRLVDGLPKELITIGGKDLTRYITAVEGLRSAIRTWDAHGRSEMHESYRYAVAICQLRDLLRDLPDTAVPEETAALLFITDTDLRESIREDIAYSDHALHGSEWKAATVLAGAAIEALLLWAIEQQLSSVVENSLKKLKAAGSIDSKTSTKPEDWALGVLREVSSDLNILKSKANDLVRIAQSFRNLIHPGRSRRLGEKCTRSTGYATAAALARVIEDLS
jgi:hypothetical protein